MTPREKAERTFVGACWRAYPQVQKQVRELAEGSRLSIDVVSVYRPILLKVGRQAFEAGRQQVYERARQAGVKLQFSMLEDQIYELLVVIAETIGARFTDAVALLIADTLRTVGADIVDFREVLTAMDVAFAEAGLAGTDPFLLETWARTYTSVVMSEGHWDAAHDGAIWDILWGWEYKTVGDDRVRPGHVGLEGMRLPKEDPRWELYWPPNDWNCRCDVIEIFTAPTGGAIEPRAVEVDGKQVEPWVNPMFHFAGGLTMGKLLLDSLGSFTPNAQAEEGKSRRYVKDLIRTGQYKHPVHGWTLDVSKERLERWLAAFKEMQKNKVDVEMVVDHRQDAEGVRGYVKDMFLETDAAGTMTLYGIHEFRTPEAETLAKTVKNVSVQIEPEFKDGQGHVYGESITHVSICQKPVVPGQGEFMALSLVSPEAKKEIPPMKKLIALLAQQLSLQLADDVSEDTAVTAVSGALNALKQKIPATPAAPMEMSILDELADAQTTKIDSLVGKSINQATADKLKSLLLGKPGERKELFLSRKAYGGTTSLVTALCDALKDNVLVNTQGKTGPQQLSMLDDAGKAAQARQDHEIQTDLANLAGVPQTSK